MTIPPHLALGKGAEDLARTWLEHAGWHFVAANWRCAAGELDLVMLDGGELVFVEVKARRGEQAGRAEESLSPAKGQRLLSAAEWFLAEHEEYHDTIWRIDLLAVTLDRRGSVYRVTHVENAVTTG